MNHREHLAADKAKKEQPEYNDELKRATPAPEQATTGSGQAQDAKGADTLEATFIRAVEGPRAKHDDTRRIDWLQSEYVTPCPFAMPTPGGDDADVGWRLTHEVQGQREPVEIHTEYRDDLRAAIDAAILSTASPAGAGGVKP